MSTTDTVRRLNWGCGPRGSPGWLNSDIKQGEGIDISEDIRHGLSIESDSLDYVVSIHALPMIPYPDLVPVLRELRRVLRPAGVLRLALPDLDKGIRAYLDGDASHFLVADHDVSSLGGKFIVHMLWHGYSVSMFTADFIEELLGAAGFDDVRHCGYRHTFSRFVGITDLDDRERESLFVEATKPEGGSQRTVDVHSEATNRSDAARGLDPLTSGMASIACRTRAELDRVRSSPAFRHHGKLLDAMAKRDPDVETFAIEGYCLVCDEATTFLSVHDPADLDAAGAGWPGRLRCQRCGLDDHQRAMYWFTVQSAPEIEREIYVAEQAHALSSRLEARFGPSVLCHDDVDHLPFADERFGLVVSLGLLEHVDEPKPAIDELRRVLRPGGQLLLTVPFFPDRDSNTTRPHPAARPLTEFGWELVDDLRRSFPMVTVELYQSWQYGHLGSNLLFFRCVR